MDSSQRILVTHGKSEFTIEEAYNQIKRSIQVDKQLDKEPAKKVISEETKLIRILEKINLNKMKTEDKEVLVIKEKIE